MAFLLRFLSSAVVITCIVSSYASFAAPTAPGSNSVPVAPAGSCCDDGKCHLPDDVPEGVKCEGESCDDDGDCTKRRCSGSTCKVRMAGLECTEQSCKEGHGPRCITLGPKKGQCTLDYAENEVGRRVGASCFDDAQCSSALMCDPEDQKCKTKMSIVGEYEGSGCTREGDDPACKRLGCSKGKCVAGGGWRNCSVDQDCGESGNSHCDTETGKCTRKGTGRLCYQDRDCVHDSKSEFRCSPNGKCTKTSENKEEWWEQNGKACVRGVETACHQKTCRKGKCLAQYGGTGAPCDTDGDCTHYGCVDGKCKRSDYVIVGNRCKEDANFCGQITHCRADGQCAIAGTYHAEIAEDNSGFSTSTCETHQSCKDRGYPDFCNPPVDDRGNPKPGCDVDAGLSLASPPTGGSEDKMMGRLSPKVLAEQENKDNSYAASEQAIKPADVVKSLSAVKPSFVWGKPDAKVTLTIFQDLACGQCKRVHRESFPELAKSFVDTGKLKIEFYEFPLLMGEDVARHYGVLCAAQQGKYTQFLDKVYENFKGYKVKEQASYAKTVKGLDLAKWNQCMSGTDALASIVKAHKEVGTSVGVDGTPTLFLNGESTTNFREELLANVAKLAQ